MQPVARLVPTGREPERGFVGGGGFVEEAHAFQDVAPRDGDRDHQIGARLQQLVQRSPFPRPRRETRQRAVLGARIGRLGLEHGPHPTGERGTPSALALRLGLVGDLVGHGRLPAIGGSRDRKPLGGAAGEGAGRGVGEHVGRPREDAQAETSRRDGIGVDRGERDVRLDRPGTCLGDVDRGIHGEVGTRIHEGRQDCEAVGAQLERAVGETPRVGSGQCVGTSDEHVETHAPTR